jgi:gluconate 2-dehydrogenase gamma chain
MEKISRRSLLVGAGAAAASVAGACRRNAPDEPAAYIFLTADDAAFVEPAVARLIPSDELGPGALEAGVPAYIDRQLAGEWGAGEQLYRQGPWQTAAPEFGYQLPFTPAELFRNALRVLTAEFPQNRRFGSLALEEQDAYLHALEDKPRDLGGVPSRTFFESLLELTIEGYFADPVYGGNRDMVSWKMIGFPGAYANYYELVDRHGIAFSRPPTSIGQDGSGAVHIHPARVAPQKGT